MDCAPTLRRRFLGLMPAAALARALMAQDAPPGHPDLIPVPGVPDDNATLPNGKRQRDEILRIEYDQNLRDARDLMDLARTFREDLEKSNQSVLSLSLMRKLDDMEKITKRIRNRMRH